MLFMKLILLLRHKEIGEHIDHYKYLYLEWVR